MLPHLLREIEAAAPKLVVTLGNVPLKSLLGDEHAVIGACHAQPMPAKAGAHTYTLFPLYHPASVIYNPALRAVYASDLTALKQFLDALHNTSVT
jgi:DNA polymerase